MTNTKDKTASKRRKGATPEQKEAAAARRAAIRTLCGIVKALPVEKRVLLAASYGIRTCEGRELSPYNQCLLVHQNSSVSVVGGFRQWKNLGRSVKKGERALAIWVPCGKSENSESPEANPDTDNESSFILGNVFDISQTETDEEKARRVAGETPALPAARFALPERAEALEVEAEELQSNGPADYLADTGESWEQATDEERAEYLADPDETPAPALFVAPSATHQDEFTLCD